MYQDNPDDLNRKYMHTYVLYAGQLIKIQEFGQNSDDGVLIYYAAAETGKTHRVPFNPDKLEHLIFDAQFFNRKISSNIQIAGTLFTRFPKRQYKRSVCDDNSQLKSPIVSLYDLYGQRCYGWFNKLMFSDIQELLNPTYPSYEEAIKRVEKEQCVAIGKRFAIALSNISDSEYLISSPFGWVGQCNKKAIEIAHYPVIQEISDFLRDSRQTHIKVSHANG